MTAPDSVRIPTPEPLSLRDHQKENIRYFKRQWKYYCTATGLNELPAEKRVAIFFLFIGREALTYIHEHLELSSEEMKDCDLILEALESNQPPTNIAFHRLGFHQAVQRSSDNVDEFVSRLRILAEPCGFEDKLEEMVLDRFIAGLKDKKIQMDVLLLPELTLSNAVRFCKMKELQEKDDNDDDDDDDDNDDDDDGLSNQGDRNARKVSNGAHSTTLDVDASPVECPIKQEKLDDDDDLIILNHYQKDCVSSSNRPVKRIKLETSNDAIDCEESHPQVVDVESDQARESSSTSMKLGSFVVAKDDWNKLTDPPIWKVDSVALLQKFIPIEYDGTTLHKSTAVYSGWSVGVRSNYYKAPVEQKQSSRKETIVLFRKDLVPIENQFEKINGTHK